MQVYFQYGTKTPKTNFDGKRQLLYFTHAVQLYTLRPPCTTCPCQKFAVKAFGTKNLCTWKGDEHF